MKQMVPLEAFNRLKMHLNSITTRHQAFRDTVINPGSFGNMNQAQSMINNLNLKNVHSQAQFSLNENIDYSNDFVLNSIIRDSNQRSTNQNNVQFADENKNENDLVSFYRF